MAQLKQVPFTPYFGGFVLETLTVGMYGESRNAIREYIQNAFDSIQRATNTLGTLEKGAGHIQILMAENGNYLVIRDNGGGLPLRSAAATLTSVGASAKDYTSDAGFRGIGRLSGIVFSDRLTFTTKARGETEQTTVVFNGAAMREAMSPEKGSTMSAEQLLRSTVEAYVGPADNSEDQFFEAKLEGFVDAPEECTSYNLLEAFVSQIAPVPYAAAFPYRAQLRAAEEQSGIPIEEVRITIKDGAKKPADVTKRYGARYTIESGDIELGGCDLIFGDNNNWWAWVGKKDESGSYLDPRVSGLRIRVKNIQIDGTELIRNIFKKRGRSYIRFQDWYIGEVFVDLSFLVPNARRDGFEETPAWKRMQKELGALVNELGAQSYDVSNKGQLTASALGNKVADKREEMERLRKADFKTVDKVVTVSAEITKILKQIDKAAKNADLPTAATLHALGSELTDMKAEAMRAIGIAGQPQDLERVEHDAREALLEELVLVTERELPTACAVAIRNLLRTQYGLGSSRQKGRASDQS